MSMFLPAQTPEAARRRRKRLVLLACIGLMVLVVTRPALSAFRKARLRKMIAEGEAYLAQGRRAEALSAGRSAWLAGASDARLYALLLNTLGSEKRGEAFYFWEKLGNTPEISIEQRRALVRWAIAWRQAELAEPHWRLLLKSEGASIETLKLGAALSELEGDAAGAVRYAQTALQRDPRDRESRMLLARVLVQSGGERDLEVGKRLLLEEAQRAGANGLQAIRILSGTDILSPFEATECLGWLERNPARNGGDRLTAAALHVRITPYRSETIVREAVGAFLEAKGDLRQLAAWFTTRQDWDGAAKYIPESEALKARELLLVYLDALGAKGEWEQVDRILSRSGSKGTLPLDGLSTALYRARAASQQNQARIAELRWTEALELAGDEGGALLKLADYARRSGEAAVARNAAEKLIAQRGEMAKAGFRELLKLNAGNLTSAREVLNRYTAEFPQDLTAANDLAYTELLLGGKAEPILARIQRAAEERPGYLGYQTTRALALLRMGKANEARKAFGIEPSRWVELLPYQQAVYAASAAADGDERFAREICAGIDLAKLRSEEKNLIRKWL